VTDRAFTVVDAEAGSRLDRFLVEKCPGLSRAQIQRLIEGGHVQVDGRATRAGERLGGRQTVVVREPPPAPTGLVAADIPFDVVVETPDFVVVNKPAGLVVHPAPGHAADTLVNALLARYPDLAVGNAARPGLVHRLDKGTSGLMVVALSDECFQHLIKAMQRRLIRKEYLALVHGALANDSGAIEAPIARDRTNRQRMGIAADGREARTTFRVIERFPEYTLLRLGLVTGRTHQLRVHLSAIGHPIVGDETYGGRHDSLQLDRPFLHSWYLGFEHPNGSTCVVAWAPLPPELERVLDELRAGVNSLRTPPPAPSGVQ
jgi:23S rRNA pseudouridine1911/1915/1917 synthase